jgi:glycosyltransferase involved in cell wall biosynthesis
MKHRRRVKRLRRCPLAKTAKAVCMLAYTRYETDNRVRRYAETLAKRGDLVDVIALAGTDDRLGVRTIDGVTVYSIRRRAKNEKVKWVYAWRLLRFLWIASLFLIRRHRIARYDLVHVHNVPDFLVFAAWYPKWTGAKVILDIHDIVPELFVNKFQTRLGGLYFKLLTSIEKASMAFSHHVIVANHLWRDKLIQRSVRPEKCSVHLNQVDLSTFYRRPRTRSDGKFVVLFPGTFQWHQGLDIAINAFASLKSRLPNAELHLYGPPGGQEDQLRLLASRLGLDNQVQFCGLVTYDRIPDVIANADLGIVPKRADSFGNEAYSTKIMEFMSQSVPVVVSRTAIDAYYFDEKVVHFFPSGDVSALANAILHLAVDRAARERLGQRGQEYVKNNSWEHSKGAYFKIVDSLCGDRFSSATSKVGATSPLR